MKKLVFVLATITLGNIVIAQVKEGTLLFDQKIDMHRRIPAEDAQMKAMLPHYRTNKFQLSFGDGQSFYKMQEAEPDVTDNGGGGGIVMKFGGGNTEYYRNFNTHMEIDKKELAEKSYLIEDSLHSIKWKLADDTKTILGFNCKKATGKTEKGSDIEVWYTEEIPVSSGPEIFSGLPGMILFVDINKGEFVYTATELKKTVDKKELNAPSKGKKMTPSEFAKLQKEILGDQSGPIRIIRN